MNTATIEHRRVSRDLGITSVKPMIWKPSLLKVLGGGIPEGGKFPRRRLDKWIAEGRFPQPDGIKFGHPWWYVATFEAWRNTP
jgi:hypothetical protein